MKRPYHGSFGNLSFPKTGTEIKKKIDGMLKGLHEKIEERKGRIEALAKEMKMDTSMDVLINLDKLGDGGTYANSGQEITVGKAAAIRNEIGAMRSEKNEAEKLESILRNLPDGETFKLDFDELSYFGF